MRATTRAKAARLGADLAENDGRQDYLRATLREGIATAFPQQDSSMLSVLGRADALIVRAPRAPPAREGEACQIVRLDRFW